MVKADGSAIRELAKIEMQDLLIPDDFGLQPLTNQAEPCLCKSLKTGMGKDQPFLPPN